MSAPGRHCSECNGWYRTNRCDKLTCGETCKKRRQRRLAAEARVVPDCLADMRRHFGTLYRHQDARGKGHPMQAGTRDLLDAATHLQGFAEALGVPWDPNWSPVNSTTWDP